MKLERFKEKDNKRRFIIIFTVCCIFLLAGVFLYTSFAAFTEEKQFNVINGRYQDPGDLYFAVYIDGQITNTFPSKDSGYTLDTEKSSCTNGATVSWDINKWGAFVDFTNYQAENMSRTKCTMYFIKEPVATEYITNLANTSNELVYDETSDNNLRYIGADPSNYVLFNNELWRIIGVMNNIDDGTGTKETRLKIIRDESYSELIAWDTDNINDWTTASLQEEINTTYLNSIQNIYKEMIGETLWNLGGSSTYNDVTTSVFYERERGTTVYTGRLTEWIGQIGLMYPSDYGYATSGGSTSNRASCLAKELYNWNSSNYSDCYQNDWLYDSSNYQWTLTSYNIFSASVFIVTGIGNVSQGNAFYNERAVSPALYLSSNVKITGGSGEKSDPFILSL